MAGKNVQTLLEECDRGQRDDRRAKTQTHSYGF